MEDSPRERGRWRRWLGRCLAGLAALAIAAFVAVSMMIGSDVHATEKAALREHPGNAVSALIAYVDTSEHGLRERNRAVWALGQLGSPRALPVLEREGLAITSRSYVSASSPRQSNYAEAV